MKFRIIFCQANLIKKYGLFYKRKPIQKITPKVAKKPNYLFFKGSEIIRFRPLALLRIDISTETKKPYDQTKKNAASQLRETAKI